MAKPIFGTGLARSGGGLYSACLSTHPDMMVACCPNIELFRSFRNALAREKGDNEMKASLPPSAALQDYYGTDARVRLLDMMLDGDLNVPFDMTEWPEFLDKSVARGKLEVADLAESYSKLTGKTYKQVFDNLLQIIADVRECDNRQWIGFHEVWVLDNFPALARAYPDARFLVMFRDPRAILNSLLGVTRIDPLQVVQILSYIRHWRKYVALAHKYASMPLFRGRLHITAHDLVLTRTRETLEEICKAFDLDLDEKMLDTENYYDYSNKTVWAGNSSFESVTAGISAHRALRWREKLEPVVLDAVEYLCGADLKFVGYPTFTPYADASGDISPEAFTYLLKEHSAYSNWRSDLEDPLLDLGLETVRRQLLRMKEPAQDASVVRRAFLFEETYHALRAAKTPLLPQLSVLQ